MDVFKYNKDINKTAYMNWRIYPWDTCGERFSMMSEGYFKACNIIIKELLKDNKDKRADVVIFPLMFNYIHGIELSLKAILSSLEYIIFKKNDTITKGHNIKQFLDTIIRRLRDNGMAEDAKDFKPVKKFIDELYAKTQLMDFPRYPIDTHKNNHFFVKEKENVVVDLESFEEVINTCSEILLNMEHYYENTVEEIKEAEKSYSNYE